MIQSCYNHPDKDATAICHYCQRYLCTDCAAWNSTWKYSYCKNESECLKYRDTNAGKEDVSAEKIVMSNVYKLEALIEMLERKEIVSKEEIREEIKKMRPKKDT